MQESKIIERLLYHFLALTYQEAFDILYFSLILYIEKQKLEQQALCKLNRDV